MEFKGAKGNLRFSPQEGTIGHCHAAQVWDSHGNNLAIIESTTNEEEATSYARLFSAAPELLEALQEAQDEIKLLKKQIPLHKEPNLATEKGKIESSRQTDLMIKIESAIKKAL